MLIVGLGNPGSIYENNRHNIGFMIVDKLVELQDTKQSPLSSLNGELFKFSNHFLLKPFTFMNLSGEAVSTVKSFYKIEDVVVIHDDLDLPFGSLRFKFAGGHGGHNGLKSTDEKISKNYTRVRVGIGRPEYKGEVSSYVLGDFDEKQSQHLKGFISHICSSIIFLTKNTIEDTSSKFTIKNGLKIDVI